MAGAVHALLAVNACMTPPLLHLVALNPYLLAGLRTSDLGGRLSMPRQQHGAPRAESSTQISSSGISSFAFQV